ncbi:related to GIT1-Glycerophosphoinositol transporter also able to mediate low-affinity phosphate transport [Phialocephala subalpina]|uniref:Related to GIT1-Glycerophosphoinositol transporter also able to mediate low-affinity phosphate transport n=1 Tax=Phialocephala subalpina TaxID=576137 RepID=A0A1L7WHF8_9HELO|nr:related to GIT1-Glycerophosphoinositol transporter also able to mediate low-affinity phosphate transport [Phialocephala subalpina]
MLDFDKETAPASDTQVDSGSEQQYVQNVDPLAEIPKNTWERIWPVLACGAGLFSDGYINNVIGSVSTMLKKIYGTEYTGSNAQKNISAITFAGTVVGQLVFGYTSDKWSRKNSLLLSTLILIVFAALGAGSYGYHGSLQGMFAALTAYRFLVGIGIGGEYPAGSVACSEATGELKSGTRNRWFILFTNVMIDWGFVIGAFVPYLLVVICTEKHLRAAWRISLGLGVVPPLILFWLRLKLQEPEEFKKESMKYVRIPYKLVIKYYWWRLFVVSFIWFLYDFSTYSFGIFSSTILSNIYGDTAPLSQSFGWNTVINLFYVPGAMLGSIFSDKVGPRYALASGVLAQAVVGFIMAGLYPHLAKPENVAGFAVVYGIFLSLGEVGPGDNIGLVASKTCATGVRGQYYAIAAAFGKIGAFVGTYVFPYIEKAGGKGTNASAQYPFYVSSCFCVLMAALVLFGLPHIDQDTITTEDIKFRAYLEKEGWDVRQLGLLKGESVESRAAALQQAGVVQTEDEKKETVVN